MASTAASNAWAVGGYSPAQTLIMHWNGTAWTTVATPDPGKTNKMLWGVSATSASNAWAVGDYNTDPNPVHTLALHWNGIAWKQAMSP